MSGAQDLARLTTIVDTTDELLLSPEIKMMDVGGGVMRPTNAMVMANLATQLGGAMPYATVAAGLAGTVNDTVFSVLSSADDEYVQVYRNAAGQAVHVDTYPNSKAVIAVRKTTEANGVAIGKVDQANQANAQAIEQVGQANTETRQAVAAVKQQADSSAQAITALGQASQTNATEIQRVAQIGAANTENVSNLQGLIAQTNYVAEETEILAIVDGEGGQQAVLTDKQFQAPSFGIGSGGTATILGDAEGATAFYADDERALLGPLEVRPTSLPGLYITDEYGGVLGQFDGAEIVETKEPGALDDGLLFSPVLAVAANSPSHVYVQSLLTRRELAPQVVGTLASTSLPGVSAGPVLEVNAETMGETAVLNLRTLEKPDDRRFMPLTIKRVPVQAQAVPIKILLIADSIGNNQGAMLLGQYLAALGFAATFIGTLNGTTNFNGTSAGGPLGEARSGWETGDFTYSITDRAKIVEPGQEAAYLAMPKADKTLYNPFLRAATAWDSEAFVRNGYVFDVAFYQSRFGLDTPDVIINALGTNNARDRTEEEVYAGLYNDDVLMLSQLKRTFPSAKVIRTLPATSIDSARNMLWTSHYVKVIRAMQAAAVTIANPLATIAPLWAMTNPEGGYSLPAASAGSDGFIAGDWSDPIHPFGAARHGYYKALAPFVAAAALNLI